jgi:hypothetical protein
MSLLGGSYEHCFFGSSVLDRPPESGMALMRAGDDELIFVDAQSNVFIMPPFNGNQHLYRLTIPDRLKDRTLKNPDNQVMAREMQTKALALLRSAEVLFRRHSYRLPASARGVALRAD